MGFSGQTTGGISIQDAVPEKSSNASRLKATQSSNLLGENDSERLDMT
jgi:hypothetical protein